MSARPVGIAVMILLLGGSRVGLAGAAEDAGTRSIFASGAGVRGLGMGSAYVAVAADATAAAWNVGGLGWVERSEAQASTVFHDLGFREDFASVVLPSWRWGTLALSVRRFGADGIDRRDDRNVLLQENLGSQESETSIAFGRAIGPGLSVGAAVKLQHQSVAEWSGGGFGADMGVSTLPLLALGSSSAWAPRVSFGISVRNLIEPRVHLDQESVRDPSVRRVGLAYRSRWSTTSFDLEHSSGASPRLHVGTEVTPHPRVSLRGGTNGGSWTAGAGFRLRGFGIDYAFEDRALGSAHRFGVSYGFGSTTAERRDAAMRAEEAKLQARLAEAFQRLQRERVDTLLARAREARQAARYAEALEILGTVTTLEPDNAAAGELELQCLREHALSLERGGDLAAASVAYQRVLDRRPNDRDAQVGQLRCRAESDRRAARTSDIRAAFARAMDAFAADNLPQARLGFRAVVDAAPQDEDARAMLRRTELALARRAENLIRQARRSLAEQKIAEAASLLRQARELDPSAEGVASLAAAVEAAGRAAPPPMADSSRSASPREGPAAPPPLTAQRLRELRDLYQRGLVAMREKRSADALRYWEIVWAASPKYLRVAEYLKREYLMLGLDAYSSGRLDEAVTLWERAIHIDPSDVRARGYLTRAQKQLERAREISGEARR